MLQATHDITDKLPLDKSVEGVVLQNETEIAKLSLARQQSGGKMEQHPNKSKQIETNETNKTSGNVTQTAARRLVRSAGTVSFLKRQPLATANSCTTKAAKTRGYEASATIRRALEWAMMAMSKEKVIPKIPQHFRCYRRQAAGRGGHQP